MFLAAFTSRSCSALHAGHVQRLTDSGISSTTWPHAEHRLLLGIITKSSAVLREVLDEETGEIQWFRLDPKRREYVQVSDPSEACVGGGAGAVLRALQRN